ncbi:MAG: hypothetical protein GXP62_13960 [Oligoflexia bacterium]|nr:hypothetical protein [Oligoflexia bacterium]
MTLADRVLRIHAAACRCGDAGYTDPDTGLLVLTERYLRERGYCCGAGCRHCPYPLDPYPLDESQGAGRPPSTQE